MTTTSEITVFIIVNLPVESAWILWTTPGHIMQWNNPFEDWHSPRVELDLKEKGRFFFRMEAKDGSAGFDHSGRYNKVIPNQLIEYTLDDGRRTSVTFSSNDGATMISENFEPESQTEVGMQKFFCQLILNNFKKYAEL